MATLWMHENVGSLSFRHLARVISLSKTTRPFCTDVDPEEVDPEEEYEESF